MVPVRRAWQQGTRLFFAKKNQKTPGYNALAVTCRAGNLMKVFASFFKKKRFLPYGETELLA
jgi:hypothetical protein